MWKNSLYNTIGGILKLFLGLASVPVLTKTLGLRSYGIYTSTNAILNIALFAEWSIAASITVFLSKEITKNVNLPIEEKRYDVKAISIIFVTFLVIITATGLGLNINFLASLFDNLIPEERRLLSRALQASIGIIIARLIHQFFLGILQANSKYGILNVITTIYSIVSFAISLYIAFLEGDIVLIQLCQTILSVSMIFVYYFICQKYKLLSKSFVKPTLSSFKEFSTYGFRLWVLAVGSSLFSQGDRLIVLRLFGAEISGVYSAITSLCGQINIVSSMPVQPLLPLMSEYHQRNTELAKEDMRHLFIKSFIINACIIILAGGGLLLFSNQITEVIFGGRNTDMSIANLCLLITACAYIFYSFNAVGYFTLLSVKKDAFTTRLVIISGLVSLLLIYALSINFGIIGACVGNLGYGLTLLLNTKAVNALGMDGLSLFKKSGNLLVISLALIVLGIILSDFLISVFIYLILIVFILKFLKKSVDFSISSPNRRIASILKYF